MNPICERSTLTSPLIGRHWGGMLMCSAVNDIDMSALESLEAIDHRLDSMGVRLHLLEVKGPVTDKLGRTSFLEHLSGKVFPSQHQAAETLSRSCRKAADEFELGHSSFDG